MEDFPKENITPVKGKMSGCDNDVSLEIFLEPFELVLTDYSEPFDSSIRLDAINIPCMALELEGKSFDFPVNPEEGYIDGSVYFFSAHNPVDVTLIKFGNISENRLPVTLKTYWLLEYEDTGFNNFNIIIDTYIEL